MARVENQSFRKLTLPLRELEPTLPVGVHIRQRDETCLRQHGFTYLFYYPMDNSCQSIPEIAYDLV